ncbi:MAG: MBL fold metallo-hydrolase [Pseudobdellovibrionaceae bacterium]
MKITHLGHESWAIEQSGLKVLIDPLLNDTFGTNPDYQFTIRPERKINPEIYAQVKFVILTSEYYQHFDLCSINKITKNVEIVVPSSFSNYAIEAIRKLGYKLNVVSIGASYSFKKLELIFIPGDKETSFWDSRVCSLAISIDDKTTNKDWIFIQSDTKVNSNLNRFLPGNWTLNAQSVFLTCNLKIWQTQGYHALDNFIDTLEIPINPSKYIDLISDIVPLNIASINASSYYFICGGGYDLESIKRPKPMIDKYTILKDLMYFSLNAHVFCPKPGDLYEIIDSTNYLVNSSPDIKHVSPNTREIKPFSMNSPFKNKKINIIDQDFFDSLIYLERLFLFSRLGRALIYVNEYLDKKCASERFCLQFESGKNSKQYTFCFSKNVFKEQKYCGDAAIALYPAGVRLSLNDYRCLTRGEITIAEICHSSSMQWHTGGREDSPVGFLYSAFSEFLASDLSKKKYAKILERLESIK